MGIHDITAAQQEEDTEMREFANDASYLDRDEAVNTHNKKIERGAAKKRTAAFDNVVLTSGKALPVKEDKKAKKRKVKETDAPKVASAESGSNKKNKTESKPAAYNMQTIEADEKNKNGKYIAAKEDKNEQDQKDKDHAIKVTKKGNTTTEISAKKSKNYRPKPVMFIPLENRPIPEAHLSLRQSEVESNNEKKKTANKNSKLNELVFTVISDICLTLKPHESRVFKLNGYLQSPAINLYVNVYSHQQISCDRDLCALNWEITYNDAKRELIVAIYNRGNKTQKILANEPIAVIRVLSPDAKLLLKN